MAQLLEANQVGKPDSWADLIANAETDKTPCVSMMHKRMKPKQVSHNWQVKKYKRQGHRGVRDGVDAQNFNSNAREELVGRCQKSWDLPGVSDFAEEAEVAGLPKGEMSEQIADAITAVKWKFEQRALSNQDQLADNGSSTANETRGLFKWADTAAQTLNPVPEAYRPPSAQRFTSPLDEFDESDFLPMMRSSWKQRKGPSTMDAFLGIDLKARFNDFSKYTEDVANKTQVRQFNQEASSKMLIHCIDKLVLDTGTVNLHANAFIETDVETGEDSDYTHRSGIVLDMEMVGIAFTRNPRYKPLENKGGGPRGIVDAIFMIMADNPLPMVSMYISADT